MQNAPGAFCNTFDLHQVIIGLETQVLFLGWRFYTGFTLLYTLWLFKQNAKFPEMFHVAQITGAWRYLSFSLPLCLLFTKGKDGHSAAAKVFSRWVTPLLFSLQTRAHTIWINNCMLYPPTYIRIYQHSWFHCHSDFSMYYGYIAVPDTNRMHSHLCCFVCIYRS